MEDNPGCPRGIEAEFWETCAFVPPEWAKAETMARNSCT